MITKRKKHKAAIRYDNEFIEELSGLPRYHDSQIKERIVCNHMEPITSHSQHPMPQEKKHSVSLYQSMCNVTWP